MFLPDYYRRVLQFSKFGLDRRVFFCSFALCFCVAIHYIAKPARDAYMLQYWGTANLPWLNAGVLLLVVMVARFHERVFRRLGVIPSFPAIGLFTCLVYCVTPTMVNTFPRSTTLLLSGVVGLFNLSGLAAIWGLVDSAFHREESRRVFAFAAMGGPVGGVIGSFTADKVALQGPSTLLTIASFLILVAVFGSIPLALHVRDDEQDRRAFSIDQGLDALSLDRQGWKLAFVLRYPRILLGLAITISGMGAIVKWVFFRIGELNYLSLDARTGYFASSYLSIALITLGAQIFVVPYVLTRFGAGRGLQFLPLATLGGLIVVATLRTASSLSWATLIFMAFDYTVNQCSRELLYVPTPTEIRFKTKQYVDTAGRQSGVILANGVILLLLAVHAPAVALYAVVAFLATGWFALATVARSAHHRLIAGIDRDGSVISELAR